MEYTSEELRIFRIGIAAAIITIVGTLFSGPLAFLVVSSIQPQPAWSGAQTYVANYHPVQSITFYFGFLLLFGSVLMITTIYILDNKGIKSLLALLFTSIGCGLIAFNYFTQATYIPALIRNYTHTLDPIITMFAVTNPYSLFWALEMWGYGFLGLGTLFASNFFSGHGIEKATKTIFMANGFVSLLGVLIISIRLEWVLSISGLVSYAAWNILYIVLAVLFLIVIIQRREKVK
jgi:hypothetical protein